MSKPILDINQQIQHMKKKGYKFNLLSEEDAREHLLKHNNFFKLTCYRKNFSKYTHGEKEGEYENLEFAYLKELACIDTAIRVLLMKMTLDIEHFLKVRFMKEMEEQISSGQDGYQLLQDYLEDADNTDVAERESNKEKRKEQYNRMISQNRKNSYCGDLIKKYEHDMPVWVYIELVSFGDLKDLISYCKSKKNWNSLNDIDIQSLDRVRQLRNACAHNNAIINNLTPVGRERQSGSPKFVTDFIIKLGNIKKVTRKKKLSNPRINQIIHLLYNYCNLVPYGETKKTRIDELKKLIIERIPKHKEYFSKNDLLRSTYLFFHTIVKDIDQNLQYR